MGHGAEGNGTKIPDDARGQTDMPAVADAPCAAVEQCLAAAVAVILDPITIAPVI